MSGSGIVFSGYTGGGGSGAVTSFYNTGVNPASASTALLLHCDAFPFVDSSTYNQTVTNSGSAVQSSASYKFGSGSYYNNDTTGNKYLSITNSMLMIGSNNFTMDLWINPTVNTGQNFRFIGNLLNLQWNSGAWAAGFNAGNSGKLNWDVNNGGSLITANAVSTGTWSHVAFVRSGNNWYLFLNGVLEATTTSATSLDNGGAARPVYIGFSGYDTTASGEYYNGYLDEIRIVNGLAVWTSNFTPPTAPYSVASAPISLTRTALFYQLPAVTVNSAAGAYSLRAVNGATPIAVQVRRSSDSATQDFYADSRGNLLTAPVTGQTLVSWLGGATGNILTWYDQSGAGYHMIQSTAANQPIIQRATKGPGYSVYFAGNQGLVGPSYTVLNSTNYTISSISRRNTSYVGDMTVTAAGTAGNTDGMLHNIYRAGNIFYNGQISDDIQVTVSTFNATNEPLHYSFVQCSSTSGRDIYLYGDQLGNPIKTQDLTKKNQLSLPSGNVCIGFYQYPGGGYFTGEIFEVLVFKTSAYDTDGTTGTNVPTTVQTIYNNQFAYTG